MRADDFPPEVGGRKNSVHLGVLGPEPQNDSLGGTDPPRWDLNIRGGKNFRSIPGRFEQGILAFFGGKVEGFFLMELIGKFSWKKWIFEDQFHSHTVDGYKMWTSSTSPDFLPKSVMFWRTFVSCCIHT